MLVHYRTKGFVFKKENRQEADIIFSVFTYDFGRLEVFAKAIRKITSKLKGGIEIFSFSEIEFIQGRNRKTLIDALLIEKFKNIAQVPEKLEIAYKISSIINNFVRGEEKDENIFNLLKDVFEKLNDSLNYKLIYSYFFWNFVFILGYGPELSKCAACRQKLNPYNLYFSNKEGGIICINCSLLKPGGIKVKSDIVKVLRLILKKDWNILSRLKVENDALKLLKVISENYYNYLSSSYSFKNNSEETS